MYSSCNFGRTLSVGAICFGDRFCTSKKGRIGGGGWVSARGAVHMAAALAGCRKTLVDTGLAISFFLPQTGVDKAPLPL